MHLILEAFQSVMIAVLNLLHLEFRNHEIHHDYVVLFEGFDHREPHFDLVLDDVVELIQYVDVVVELTVFGLLHYEIGSAPSH
jgi:hypothetical protein